MQAVENILDDQTIRFKKGAVVSGTAVFVHCGTIDTQSDVQAIIGCSAMKFCTSMRYFY